MIAAVFFILFLPACFTSPFHSNAKRSMIEDIFFSENWRDLFNYYSEECSDKTKNTVLKWSVDCLYVCDDYGNPLFLDRRGNLYDVGLGSVALAYGPGATRPPSDTGLYLGDPCPVGTPKKSIVYFKRENDRKDPYVVICNQDSEIEFLSLRFSRCPGGNDQKEIVTQEFPRVEKGDCLIQHDNTTKIDIKHGEYRSVELRMNQMDDEHNLCRYEYCCHAIMRYFTGTCGITDHCDRMVQ